MVPLPILAQVLTHMKNSGLIQYEHDPHDGESKLILLTKLAYDCMPAVRKAFQQSDEDMIQSFASSEVEALVARSEEHTSELQSLMRISYAVFCLKKKKK